MSTPALASFEPTSFLLTGNSATTICLNASLLLSESLENPGESQSNPERASFGRLRDRFFGTFSIRGFGGGCFASVRCYIGRGSGREAHLQSRCRSDPAEASRRSR
jgi:hypothetical protein